MPVQMLAEIDLSIWLTFLYAAYIKAAQGSSQVTLIKAASIMTPMIESLGLATEMEKAMVVLAIGAGSSVFSHANDSFFWVVTQLTGMDTKMGYRLFSLGTLVLGLTAATTLFIIYLFIG
jgi:GntP family gluconate:H+ symporter